MIADPMIAGPMIITRSLCRRRTAGLDEDVHREGCAGRTLPLVANPDSQAHRGGRG
jgi:hypothetical protein